VRIDASPFAFARVALPLVRADREDRRGPRGILGRSPDVGDGRGGRLPSLGHPGGHDHELARPLVAALDRQGALIVKDPLVPAFFLKENLAGLEPATEG
jgi:hypothetical protein